jgi:hypothetical protein
VYRIVGRDTGIIFSRHNRQFLLWLWKQIDVTVNWKHKKYRYLKYSTGTGNFFKRIFIAIQYLCYQSCIAMQLRPRLRNIACSSIYGYIITHTVPENLYRYRHRYISAAASFLGFPRKPLGDTAAYKANLLYKYPVLIIIAKEWGFFLHVLHVYYSFHQKCSILDTFTTQGLKT